MRANHIHATLDQLGIIDKQTCKKFRFRLKSRFSRITKVINFDRHSEDLQCYSEAELNLST